ncbi:MAG: hypothetical protein ABI137_12695 [Antricoccus sp.]
MLSNAAVPLALDLTTAKITSWAIIAVLVLIALGVLFVVRAVLTKVISVVLIFIFASAIYIQRDNLAACPKTCECTFFGIHLKIPDAQLADKCTVAVTG